MTAHRHAPSHGIIKELEHVGLRVLPAGMAESGEKHVPLAHAVPPDERMVRPHGGVTGII